MRYRYFIVIGLLVIVACNSHNKIDTKLISKLSRGDFQIPSVHGFLYLFFAVENEMKGQSNVNVLHQVYTKYYSKKYVSFKLFLSDALNQKIVFKKYEFDKHDVTFFKINQLVKKQYDNQPLGNFISKYFISNDKRLSVKSEYQNDQHLMSLLYYLFLNNYEVTFNDNIGKYYVRKIAN